MKSPIMGLTGAPTAMELPVELGSVGPMTFVPPEVGGGSSASTLDNSKY